MDTKPLAFAIVGFLLGGFVVSVAATVGDDPDHASQDETSITAMTHDLTSKRGDAYDAAFIAAMIEHHRSAVDMAGLSAQRAKHPQIKQLSKEIIRAQSAEIALMEQWQQRWGYHDTGSTSHSTP